MSSRTDNSIKNMKIGFLLQITNILLRFIVRTIFIRTLGAEYLGVSSVFTNVFNILSLAELGIGTVIGYDMYKPIAQGDDYRVKQLVDFYRKFYYGIGIFISVVGICIIPFLDVLLTDTASVEYITFIFLLHVVYASSSYFFAHYRSLFTAYQFDYVNSNNTMMFSFVRTGGEILALLITKSYIMYMLIQILCTILSNYVMKCKAKKRFALLNIKAEPLKTDSIKKIMSNAFSMLSIRVGQTVVNSTDNLIISAMISTVLVGIYGNYSMIISILLSTTVVIENAIIASLGNLCTEDNKEKKYSVFRKFRCGFSVVYGLLCSGLIALFNPFVELWIGSDYLLSMTIVTIVVLNFYLSGIRQPVEAYIYADGLFRHFRIKPWIEALINLGTSIVLTPKLGIIGVFLGTTISHLATTLWYDAFVVFKYSFEKSLINFFEIYIRDFLWMLIAAAMSYVVAQYLYDGTICMFVIAGVVVVVISVAVCLVFNYKNKYFQELFATFKGRIADF